MRAGREGLSDGATKPLLMPKGRDPNPNLDLKPRSTHLAPNGSAHQETKLQHIFNSTEVRRVKQQKGYFEAADLTVLNWYLSGGFRFDLNGLHCESHRIVGMLAKYFGGAETIFSSNLAFFFVCIYLWSFK